MLSCEAGLGDCTVEAPFDVSGQAPDVESRVLDQKIL